jgi:hypothetical protein
MCKKETRPCHTPLPDVFRKLGPDWLQTFVAIERQQNVVKKEERALTMNSFPVMANFFPLIPFQKGGKVTST